MKLPIISGAEAVKAFRQIGYEFDILVLLSRRQFGSEVSGHLTSIDKLLIAGRVGITSQEEELAFIGEDVLHPEASRIGMRRGLVDNRDVGTGNSAIGRNNDLEIRLTSKFIAETQPQIVPHNSDCYLTLLNVGITRTSWGKIAFLLQVGEEINPRLNIVEAAAGRQSR